MATCRTRCVHLDCSRISSSRVAATSGSATSTTSGRVSTRRCWGQHLLSEAAVTVELVDKLRGDRGGGPVLHDGRPVIAEHFRLPVGFDGNQVPVFNTNTFIVDARELLALQMEWTYVRVNKQVGDRQAIQFERLLGELTEGLDTSFVRVPRSGEGSRFMPIKTREDVQVHRALIELLVERRGLRQTPVDHNAALATAVSIDFTATFPVQELVPCASISVTSLTSRSMPWSWR